jgi:prevent-host-death family protein
MKTRVVSATEFKAKCLALIDDVQEQGESITITRRGQPVAVLGPAKRIAFKSSKNSWAGRAKIVGDIVNSDPDLWDVVRDPESQL